MGLFQTLAALLTLTAVFAYINHQTVRLPTTIGVMLIALGVSLALLALHAVGIQLDVPARELLTTIDFDETLLQGMLSFLLFAGALHVDLGDLVDQRGVIALLATVGVAISTAVIGVLTFWAAGALGLELRLIDALLFGALISPTDPIAVMGLLKTMGVPRDLETKIAGESLFNDGVGVVLFLILWEIRGGEEAVTFGSVATLFATEAIGGALFGAAVGYVAFRMLRSIDNYKVEVLVTLALVTGGYALAGALHLSAPIAIVVAGLLIGNQGRAFAMSDITRERLDVFWELIDEVLNAVLFVLIGLELLVLTFRPAAIWLALLAIPIALLGRVAGVFIPLVALHPFGSHEETGVKRVLVWGGLRGGISVALALSLPPGPVRETLLVATYAVVVFSIVVQGLTVPAVVKRVLVTGPPRPEDPVNAHASMH